MRLGSIAALVASACLAAGGMAVPAAASTSVNGPELARAGGHRAVVPPVALAGQGASARAALTALAARQRDRLPSRVRRPGTVTGVVRAFTGLPLAGACVTAVGSSGAGSARTSADGRFSIAGLRAGRYTLHFSDCAHPGWYLPQWSGGAVTSALATPLQVSSGKVSRIAPVRLHPASQAALFARPRLTQTGRAASDATRKPGGVSGRLTGPHGQVVTHTCVAIIGDKRGEAVPVTSKGTYTTGRTLPPGRYKVEFSPLECGANPGNWQAQWYKNKPTEAKANTVRIGSGKVTRNISGRLRHGSIITGTVTSQAGKKLSGKCVVLASQKQEPLAFVPYHHGSYSIRGVPAGRYRVVFVPGCGDQSPYLFQWWRDKPTFKRADIILVRPHSRVTGISARLRLGGKITGTARLGSATGPGLSGICVDAQTNEADDFFTITGQGGTYVLEGLTTGKYAIFFSTGCGNNGNYLDSRYPGRVPVTRGKTTSGIDGVLQPGGLITGKVTDPSGRPIARMDVDVEDPNGDGDFACTNSAGTYRIPQLPPGRYTVEFINDCGGKGSWAPQFYPDKTDFNAAVPVPVGRGQHVSGINATMHPGGVIAGTLTSRSGKPAGKICAVAQSLPEAFESVAVGGLFEDDGSKTGSNGHYQVSNLPAGRYAVQFLACGSPRYADRWFGGRPGTPVGDIVDVGAGAVVRGVGATLAPGGAVAGTLRNRAGKPLPASCAVITNLKTGTTALTFSDFDNGRYKVGGLAVGGYRVFFYSCLLGEPYATQWYNRKPSPRAANVVRVAGSHVTGSVDASLVKGGAITGQLTDKATGRPLRDICVEAISPSGNFFGFGNTNGNGRYTVTGLNTADYELQFTNCDDTSTTVAQRQLARTVHVSAPRTVTGVSAALPAGGSISGRVLAGTPAVGQSGVCVEADPVKAGVLSRLVLTGPGGRYQVPNLQPGRYKVHFLTRDSCDTSQDGLVPQWYKGAGTAATATIVTVRAGHDSGGIDATLGADGGISGRVTVAGTGAPVTGACVRVVPLAARQAASFTASNAGRYAVTGLPAGRYKVEFSSGCGVAGLATQWWRDKPSAATATVIVIKAGAVTTGISAALRH